MLATILTLVLISAQPRTAPAELPPCPPGSASAPADRAAKSTGGPAIPVDRTVARTARARGVVRAAGIGRAPAGLEGPRARLMAERAAKIVAGRNLLAKLGYASAPGQGFARRIRVTGLLRGHRYLPTRYLGDRTAVVTIELPVRHLSEEVRKAEPLRAPLLGILEVPVRPAGVTTRRARAAPSFATTGPCVTSRPVGVGR